MFELKSCVRVLRVESVFRLLFVVVVAMAGAAGGSSSAQAMSFQGLGQFENAGVSTGAWGISDDGAWVAGRAQVGQGADATRFVRWSATTGLENLGTGIAFGVSDDGSVLAGSGSGSFSGEAIQWTEPTGIESLGPTTSSTTRAASGLSADGSVIVGRTANSRAFRWTEATGAVELPWIDGSVFGDANAVSADGSVVVGQSRGKAVLWAGGNAPIDLGLLPGAIDAIATAVSTDGTNVVGVSGMHAFLWTETDGMQDLGLASPDNTSVEAFDVSADGSVVVGRASFGGDVADEATIWDPVHGQRLVVEVLAAELDMTGWELFLASAVSDDGRTIVGIGHNPDGQVEGWIAVVPEPSSALLVGLGIGCLASLRRA